MQQPCSEYDVSTFCPSQVYFHTFSSCNGPQSIVARLPVYRLSVKGGVKSTQKRVLDADAVHYIYRFLPVHVSVLMQLSDINRVFIVVAYEVTAIHTKLQALINPFNSSYINKCVNF